jgi:hypothetical protein
MSGRAADLESLQNRRLSPAEARAYLEAPITEAERDEVRALVAWFCRRYPTPLERLTYVRRAYARWQRTQGLARPRGDRPGAVQSDGDHHARRSKG